MWSMVEGATRLQSPIACGLFLCLVIASLTEEGVAIHVMPNVAELEPPTIWPPRTQHPGIQCSCFSLLDRAWSGLSPIRLRF